MASQRKVLPKSFTWAPHPHTEHINWGSGKPMPVGDIPKPATFNKIYHDIYGALRIMGKTHHTDPDMYRDKATPYKPRVPRADFFSPPLPKSRVTVSSVRHGYAS